MKSAIVTVLAILFLVTASQRMDRQGQDILTAGPSGSGVTGGG